MTNICFLIYIMFLVKKQVQFQQIQQILQHHKMATNNPESFISSFLFTINHTCYVWRKALSIKKKFTNLNLMEVMAYNFFNTYLRIINIIQGDQAHIISISDIEQLM